MNSSAAGRTRDAGLVRGVGLIGLSAAFVGYIIGSGVFAIPGAMAGAVGIWSPLVYLGCAGIIACVMLCLANASARVPTSGGPYGIAAAAFGPFWGWLTGAFLWAGAVLAAGAIAAAAADAASLAIPALASGPWRAAAIIGWFALLALVNIGGVGLASRFVTAGTVIKLVPLAMFLIVGSLNIETANFAASTAAAVPTDFGRAALLGIFLYMGFESVLAMNGEVRDPVRTIPRALLISLSCVTLIYVGVQLVAQGLLGGALAGSKSPLVDAMARVSPALKLLLVSGAVLSMLGTLAADALTTPRVLFAFARDGLLPTPLGRLHRTAHVPHIAIITHVTIAAGLAVTGSFAALIIIATLLVVVVYAVSCAAALLLQRRNVQLAGPVAPMAVLPVAAAVAFGALVWLCFQSTRAEAIGIAIYAGVVALLYLFRRRQPLAAS